MNIVPSSTQAEKKIIKTSDSHSICTFSGFLLEKNVFLEGGGGGGGGCVE